MSARFSLTFVWAFLVLFFSAGVVGGDVVINELMYHAPDEREDLQYIELFNTGTAPVDLSGWSFKKGVQFQFGAGVALGPGGFVIIARDTNAFTRHYGPNGLLLGNFGGRLSHNGETISLVNRQGKPVDAVTYSDGGAWPHGPDGYSPSLERICPTIIGAEPANWAASKMPLSLQAAGSPGKTNDNYSPKLPPMISMSGVTNVASPSQAVTITVTVASVDPGGIRQVLLLWTSFSKTGTGVENQLAMQRVSGDGRSGRYEGTLRGQPSGTLTRFRIQADDTSGLSRFAPGENEPRPTFSVYHFANTNSALVPLGFLIQTDVGQSERRTSGRGRGVPKEPSRGNGAFIYAETNGGPVQLFDHVHLEPRSGGWNVHFQRDRLFNQMTSLNIIFESPRWVLSEPLGYEVFARAGVPTPGAGHMRLWENGHLRGYHLFFDQINKAFLARHKRDRDSDLFKLLWYGRDVVGQHQKKTNPLTGHTNLLTLINALAQTSGKKQWQLINDNFNVDEVASYFAVNQLIANWDGFHNNYFACQDVNGAGKWEMYPWDLDKTFGDFDGAPPDYAWYDLPLTYGMEGDVSPPRDRNSPTRRERGPFGGLSWWRRGGYFSRPLLANPEFGSRFLARLRHLCETEFTEEKLYPWINDLERRLELEVRIRALANGEDETAALRAFHSDIESLRQFIKGRRAFLLRELQRPP